MLAGTSRLHDSECRNWLTPQVNREYASSTREVARRDPTIARFSAPSTKGETQTHAGSIDAALLERVKELVDIPRQSAALVLDFDEHVRGACANLERDSRPRPRELEGVLQKVSDNRGENLSVGRDRQAHFDRRDDEADATSIRLQCRRRGDLSDERGNGKLLRVLNALRETDFGKRTDNERVRGQEAAMKHGAGAPRHVHHV